MSTTYHIVRSYRHGNVNGVAFDGLYGDRYGQGKLLQLLMGFDINCAQAGIDLATGRLECTPAFQQFWQTRQLLITNVQTPNHTAMRWFKKRHDLPGAFGNDDAAMETVCLLHHAMTARHPGQFCEQRDLRWRFGKKNARLYYTFQSQLAPYFSLEAGSKRFHFLSPRHTPDRVLIDLARRYPMRLLPYWYNELHRPRKSAAMSRVQFLLSPGATRDSVVNLSQGAYIQQGETYPSGNVNTTCLQRVDAFARQHPYLLDAFFTLTAIQQIAELAEWHALARRYGSWIYGYVELQIRRYGHRIRAARDWQQELDEELACHADPDTPLRSHAPFVQNIGSFSCRELMTRRAVLDEGKQLRHCVGGFVSELRSGHSRIIQLRHMSDRSQHSTIEFVPRLDETDRLQWVINQHFASMNTAPSAETGALQDQLLLAINSPDSAALPHSHASLPSPMSYRQAGMSFRFSSLVDSIMQMSKLLLGHGRSPKDSLSTRL